MLLAVAHFSDNFSKDVIERILTLVELEGLSFVNDFVALFGVKSKKCSVKSSVDNLLKLTERHMARLGGDADRPVLDDDEKENLSSLVSAMAGFTGYVHPNTNQLDDKLLALEKKEADATEALQQMDETTTLESIFSKEKLGGVDVSENFDDEKRNQIYDSLTDAELLKVREVRI